MAKRLLSYPLLILTLLLAVFIAADIAVAERPEDCAPEDREITGNTNSPCKWNYRADEITTVRYDVMENTETDVCHEVLIFSPYDGTQNLPWEASVEVWMGKKNNQGSIGSTWGNFGELAGKSGNSITTIPGRPYGVVGGPPAHNVFYSVNSTVPEKVFWGTSYRASSGWSHTYQGDYDALKIYLAQSDEQGNEVDGINTESRWLPMPAKIVDFNLLMNDCLAGIKQRLENEAKLEEVRQKVEAERVAHERAAKQAAAEAERQRLETEGAREALRLARETELAMTQAIIQQLEREKIVIGIWQEIVDERLAGSKARAEITNAYLTEIEANAAEFKASVVAKAAEIRRLQEINATIAAAIVAYNDEVEHQLAAQAQREAEQRAKLEDLHIEPPELTPAPTTGP